MQKCMALFVCNFSREEENSMKFSEAYEALKQGAKIKMPEWAGFWAMEDGNIKMHCKDGRVLDIRETEDIDYTLGFIMREDWILADDVAVENLNIRTFTFGEAIRKLKAGQKVARKGWNGKGIYIEMQKPDEHSKMTLPYIYIVTNGLVTDNPDAPKGVVPWMASQTDMLATDWRVVE